MIEATLFVQVSPYATLEIPEISAVDKSYDENGDINFNDYYLSISQMFLNTSGFLIPSPDAHPDVLFTFDNNVDIQPINR